MKNIRSIMSHDIRKITSSAVAMITIMGLCIIPCLYAWFNIFSNWDPYAQDATGRIAVAVANEDEGAEMLGFSINVGIKIIDALKANDDIGWVFVDSRSDALDGVYSSEYYAALVIPKDFSSKVMSFIGGEPENPRIYYYENEKKNAIAPKITGKAKTAVVEQVDATFVGTLAKYVSEAAAVADANGLNPQGLMSDISSRMESLSDKLESTVVMIDAVRGLTNTSGTLLDASDSLIGSTQETIAAGKDILDSKADELPSIDESDKAVSSAVRQEAESMYAQLEKLSKRIEKAGKSTEKYDSFVRDELDKQIAAVERMRRTAEKEAEYLNKLGQTALADRFEGLAGKLEKISGRLEDMKSSDEDAWDKISADNERLLKLLRSSGKVAGRIAQDADVNIKGKLNAAVGNARTSLKEVSSSLSGSYGNLGELSKVLDSYSSSLRSLEGGLSDTQVTFMEMQQSFNTLGGMFDRIARSNALDNINGVFSDDAEAVSEFLETPVDMDTEAVYPIREYGSAMAPFYTVLAQWIGALLTCVLVKTSIRRSRELPQKLRLHQSFFGRYGLYLFIGLSQALIVALGDLLYVDIYCRHDVRLVIAACVNGIVFQMINYALVFALDNIGMGAAVIILVLQVAGAGGTYPVEVLPGIFRKLYPFMPFRYAMDAMKECIGGMYGDTYIRCLGTLGLFFIGAVAFGLILYKPAGWLNRLVQESKAKSEIML